MPTEAFLNNWFLVKVKAQLPLVLLGLFFLFLFHYVEPHNGGIGLEVPHNSASWISVSLIISLGLFQIAKSGQIVYGNLGNYLLLCVCLMSIPALYPGSKLINESPLHLALLGGYLFFFSLQQFKLDKKQVNIVLYMILSAGIIEAVIGWHNYLGIDWYELTLEGPGSDIPYGSIRQRNSLSTLFVTCLVISAWLLSPDNDVGVKNRFRYVLNYSLVLSPILLIPLIIILKSRTGWISSAVSLALLLPFLFSIRRSIILRAWILSIILGILLVPVITQLTYTPEVVSEDKFNLSGPRSYFYEQVLDLALEKPILGHGFGSFENEYVHFSAEGFKNGVYDNPAYENLSHPHNEILYWWIEGGVLALAGILLAAFVVLRCIFKVNDSGTKFILLALFFPIVLHTQTEIPFYTSIGHWFIFLTLIMVVDFYTEEHHEKSINYTLLPGLLAVMIPVLVSLFMLSTLQSARLLNRVEKDMQVNVDILENITNPVVWQDRLMWDMNFGLLALGAYQNKPELALNYINWAPGIIKRKPRAGYYHYLVLAHKLVGDEVQAKIVQDEAEYLFPTRTFDFDISVLLNIKSKNIDDIQVNMIAE